jgi:hypothetical protein
MARPFPIMTQFGKLQTGALFRPAEPQSQNCIKIEPVLSVDLKGLWNAVEIENGKPCYFMDHNDVKLQKRYERYVKQA